MTTFQQTKRIFIVLCFIALLRPLWLYHSGVASWYLELSRDAQQSARFTTSSDGRRHGFHQTMERVNVTDIRNETNSSATESSFSVNSKSFPKENKFRIRNNHTTADEVTQGTSQLKSHNQTHVKHLLLTPNDSIYPPKKWPNISTTPIVLHEHKLVLFTTEKIGSTVLKQLCRRMEGHANYDHHGKGIPHMYPKNGLKYLNLYDLEEANSMLTDEGSEGSDGWTRAMFVRDPKERVLSGYLMWVPGISLPSKKIMEMAQDGLIRELLGFNPDDFISNSTNASHVRNNQTNNDDVANESTQKNINDNLPPELNPVSGTKPSTRHSLGSCCRDLSRGDFKWEILCLRHVKSFSGFLDMIQNGAEDNLPGNMDADSPYANITNTTIDSSFSKSEYLKHYFQHILRNSPACQDKHWAPLTPWRMEQKFYPQLNFIGHLETAHWDIHRLLDRISPNAWNEYGASGWGANRNESMFQSSSTVHHAKKAENYLKQYYSSEEIERRVERIFRVDYENEYLDLELVPIGEAGEFYRRRFLERWGDKYEWVDADVDH